MRNIIPFDLTQKAEELRQLILNNPDLPIVVLAGEEANCGGDYYWMYCSSISFRITEILDCETPYSDCVCSDRDSFEEDFEEWLWDEMATELRDRGIYDAEPSEDEFQARLKEEKERYGPYWKKVIAIYADN